MYSHYLVKIIAEVVISLAAMPCASWVFPGSCAPSGAMVYYGLTPQYFHKADLGFGPKAHLGYAFSSGFLGFLLTRNACPKIIEGEMF